MVYVGKLIHSKGVHSLVSAFARVRGETGARLLVIGFGTFREGLEALVHSLSAGDETTVERLAELGKLLEGGPAGPARALRALRGAAARRGGVGGRRAVHRPGLPRGAGEDPARGRRGRRPFHLPRDLRARGGGVRRSRRRPVRRRPLGPQGSRGDSRPRPPLRPPRRHGRPGREPRPGALGVTWRCPKRNGDVAGRSCAATASNP